MSMKRVVLKEVSKNIKGTDVLNEISVEFEAGNIYGLCGRNGSGKTMLLRMIAGLIKPTKGEVYIDEKLLHRDIDFPENIGVMIENPEFWKEYTGMEALYSLASINKKIGMKEMEACMRRVELDPLDKRTLRKYSLGMKKRLGIAQAIMENPEIILLDEPSNALDKQGVEMIKNIILEKKRKGNLIIITSHRTEDLEVCDKIMELENGWMIEGETYE